MSSNRESVPPDPDAVTGSGKRKRPGYGMPGEDATQQPKGRRGESQSTQDAATEPGDRLPGRRLDTRTGEVKEED